MRATVWLTASVMALALAARSPKQAAAPSPPPPAPASEPAPPLPAASAPAPESPPAAAQSPETAASPTPAAAPYRFSPGDYGRQERRIAALIANAETRDTLGETRGIAAQGQRARERCSTRKCVEAAYAAEEARLRKWEGSGDVR